MKHDEIHQILAEYIPGAVGQNSLQYGIQGVLACYITVNHFGV